ncbi:MAG: hypothetical protein ACK5T2_12835, partial [bacterium]
MPEPPAIYPERYTPLSGPDLPARLLPVADPAASVDADLLSRIQAQRGRVSALYGTLLHSPP